MTSTDTDRDPAITAVLEREKSQPESFAWLSFADPGRPKGEQFLGATIVKARGPGTAVLRAHELGINPGGEVNVIIFGPEQVGGEGLPQDQFDFMFEHLRSMAEIDAAGISH